MTKELAEETAHILDQQIVQANYNIRANFIALARLLCQMRDEKLYLVLGHPSFNSYLADVGVEMDRSWAYRLIRAWEKFSVGLGVPDRKLIEVGPTKLDIIAPVVNEGNKDEWLDKSVLSKGDLISEVRSSQGKPPLLPAPSPRAQINPGIADLLKYKTYLDYVRDQPCIVCGKPGEPHHWPVTRGAGGKEVEEWAIPLCRADHDDAHRQPHKFMHDYSHRWAAYFYGLILRAWETA